MQDPDRHREVSFIDHANRVIITLAPCYSHNHPFRASPVTCKVVTWSQYFPPILRVQRAFTNMNRLTFLQDVKEERKKM